MDKEKKVRDSNIELFRILLMFMIILHHLITRGCGLKEMMEPESFQPSSTTWFQLLINSFIVCAVNGYVFISGYFGINFKIKRLLLLISQALFYSVILYLLMSVLGYADFNLRELIKSFLPVNRSIWWFFNCFIALYILSPIINKGLSLLNKGQVLSIIILLFYLGYVRFIPNNSVAGTGFSVYSFLFLYILANFFRRFNITIKKPLLLYIVSSLLIFLIAYYSFIGNNLEWSWGIFSYNNPLVLIAAVSLFYVFRSFNIQKKWINTVASFTFGIYLFHEMELVNPQLANIVKYMQGVIDNPVLFFPSLLLLAAIVFIVGMAFDKVRQVICEPLIDYLLQCKMAKKITAYLGWDG